MMAKKPLKKCTACSEFLFAYFIVVLSLLVALPCRKIFDMQQFVCKTGNLMRNMQQNGRRLSYPSRGPLIFRNRTVITAQVVETLVTVNDGP